jgi:glucose/arabinose dehydrogenase
MRRAAAVPALGLALAVLAACSAGSPGASPSSPAVPGSAAASPGPSATPSRPASPTATLPPLTGTPRLVLVGRFTSPVYAASPPGDPRLFVVEQAGVIRIVRGGRTVPAPFLDISADVRSGGERGLLSVAFAPDYATSARFYVDYTDLDGDTRIVEFRASPTDPDRADPGSRRELLGIDQPYPNHNGGLLLFDPTGRLLIGMGDGGSQGDPDRRAQDLGDLLGKILRIDPLRQAGGQPYGIPADNPFAHRAGARAEIWAYGVRNPWRFSFDPATGDFYLGDVGQNTYEEIDAVPPARQSGANYGWRIYEGRSRYARGSLVDPGRLVQPVNTYSHSVGCSVTGGVVYRGRVAALRGRYLFGDYCSGELWSFPAGVGEGPAVTRLPFSGGQPTSFGVDAAGEAYVLSATGEVWRISA